MKPDVGLHVVAGAIAIVSGFVALYAAKGGRLHRRAGLAFVASMLAMTTSGALIAVFRNAEPALNVPAAALAAYLVVTAATTVRPPAAGARALERTAFASAFVLAVVCLASGAAALARGGGLLAIPAFPFTLFGLVASCGAIGDARLLCAGGVRGAARIRRHLWRMTFALWIATASFFLGQADEIPRALRVPALLAAPVLAVLVTLAYWLVRYRPRAPRRVTSPQAGTGA